MKTAKKLLGIITLAVVIGFTMAACGDNGTTGHTHDWGDWEITKEANCTETGSRYRVCADDETHKETETIAIITDAHDYRYDPNGGGTAPTCTADGQGNEVCSRNPSHPKKEGVVIGKLGHNFIFEEETKQATCSETGTELWKCTRDDTTEERTVPIDPSAHDWETLEGTTPTCTEPGNGSIKCTLCEEEENGELEPLGHDNGSWHIHTEATCEVDGKEERRCNRDDFVLETKTIEKLGHEWEWGTITTAPTCTTEGEQQGICKNDPEHETTRAVAVDTDAHDWGDWTLTTPASILAEGVETSTCKNDSSHTETRSIPMLISLIDVVQISAGTFTMGQADITDATPEVTLTQGFYMGKYQVTQEQYQAVMGTNPSWFTTGVTAGEVQEKRPVEQVIWYDALVFCNKLSVMEGLTPAYSISGSTDPDDWGTVPTSSIESNKVRWDAVIIVSDSNGYRLPTEAQWEYACRAGTTTAYNTGATINTNTGWYDTNSNQKTHEVGKKPPNDWGLYDMHGNVSEWCWDRYGTYASGAQTDPVGASSGDNRMVRGGRWNSSASSLRSAVRGSLNPLYRGSFYGFRILRP